MSFGTARVAVASFLSGSVPGLTTVYRSRPKVVDDGRDIMAPGSKSGAFGFVHIDGSDETRVAFGGAHSGKKRVDYQIRLVIKFQSKGIDAMAAQDDCDLMLEGVKVQLRSDRQLGDTVNVWQAGEAGGIKVQIGEPILHGDITVIWAQVSFQLTEWQTT